MIISHDVGKSISLTVNGQAEPTWVLEYGSTPKPHFSSLRTPAGHELAMVEPMDHLWHRGLWFTIKFVNGVNFWEERDEFGVQRLTKGPSIHHDGNAVIVEMDIDWVNPGGDVPIRERRSVIWSAGEGFYTLDWSNSLAALTDLTLDRTPYTTWGGYSGLSFRGARTWHPDRFLMPGGQEYPLRAGIRAPWLDLSGRFDGGTDRTGGVAMIDRSGKDTPWYAGGDPRNTFMNAAFLFEGPLQVSRNQELDFSYRIVVHDNIWNESDLLAHLESGQ